MTPELEDLMTAIIANTRQVALLAARCADHLELADTAKLLRESADDLRDAWTMYAGGVEL